MANILPTWASQPFSDILDHTVKLDKILHISMHGISLLRGIPKTIEVLRDTADEDEKDGYGEERLETARQEATLAQSEVDNGFPILHAQIIIALWSALESLVRTFLAAWLTNIADVKSCDELKKVKVKLGDYESLVGDDRNFYILDLLEDSMGTRRNPGIGRFEALLNAFGLSSNVEDEISKVLFELYHVRNVLVHRNAIADRKIVASCPWLNLSVGQTVTIAHQAYVSYYHAIDEYVLELIQRTRVYFGLGRYEETATKFPNADIPNNVGG
jgi:hypothetical protein